MAAGAAGLVFVAVVAFVHAQTMGTYQGPDFTSTWLAARGLLHNEELYGAVADARWPYPYYYPATAPTLALLFGLLPLAAATFAFAGLSGAILAYALISRRGWWALLWLASGPALVAAGAAQWSPLLTAGALIPGLSFVWAAKPTIGLAVFAGYGTRRTVIGGLLLVAAAFALQPDWLIHWRGTFTHMDHLVPPVTRPGGALLLVALFRWRRPEARMLATLACVPQTGSPYELVPLGLIPQTRREMMLLVALSQLMQFLIPNEGTDQNLAHWISSIWPFALVLVYLPALVMILRRPARPEARA